MNGSWGEFPRKVGVGTGDTLPDRARPGRFVFRDGYRRDTDVVHLGVLKDTGLRLGACLVVPVVGQSLLQRGEEALHRRVVLTAPLREGG